MLATRGLERHMLGVGRHHVLWVWGCGKTILALGGGY